VIGTLGARRRGPPRRGAERTWGSLINLESNSPGTGNINCGLNRRINGTTSGGTGQFLFLCADTGTGGNPSAAPDTFNPNGSLVQPGAAGDNELHFETGYSCFEFSNSLANQYPEAMTVTMRDQAGAAGGSFTTIHLYDAFGSLLLQSQAFPPQSIPSGQSSVEVDYSFGPYFQNAPIKWLCVEWPSGGGWQEATLDDICIDQ